MKKFNKKILLSVAILFTAGLIGPVSVFAATATEVDLGSIITNNFVILSNTGITNVPTSVITGNIGTSLDSTNSDAAFAGIACTDVTGSIYSIKAMTPITCELSDVVLGTTTTSTAVGDMGTAYTYAAGEVAGTGAFLNQGSPAGTLGGQTFVPGVYTWNTSVAITNNITLAGGANDIWVFQVNGILTLDASKSILLSGGAQAKNIFWQVTGHTELFANSIFEGTILGWEYIAMDSGATLHGRALSNTAVTLIGNTITIPEDVTPPTTATLHVIKTVTNDDSGNKSASDFHLSVKNSSNTDVSGSPADGAPNPGTSYTLAAGTYTVSEVEDSSYAQSISGDCNADGSITLVAGIDYTCTITNNDIPEEIIPTPPASHSSSGSTPTYGCKDPAATNYNYFSSSRPSLCTYASVSKVVTPTPVVIVPKLPATGFPSRNETLLWNIIALSGIIITSVSIFLISKKQKKLN